MHYILDGDEFGPDSAKDLIFAEVNEGELPHLDRDAGRRAFWRSGGLGSERFRQVRHHAARPLGRQREVAA